MISWWEAENKQDLNVLSKLKNIKNYLNDIKLPYSIINKSFLFLGVVCTCVPTTTLYVTESNFRSHYILSSHLSGEIIRVGYI